MKLKLIGCLLLGLMLFSMFAQAESIYDLRKLTEDEWLDMSTEDRLRALSTTRKHEPNQTFVGNFGRHYDLYKSWGYEYYEMEDRYENYAFRGYEAYNILEERRRRWSYNEFGDRISKMRHSATLWRETYSGDGTYWMQPPYNYINSAGSDVSYVDGVWVARESTDDMAFSITGAGALRTSFTPLTLSIPNLDGISIDFQSANTQMKFVSSGVLGPYNSGRSISGGYTSNMLVTQGGVMLRGGRFKRKFGALTLGASYANTYGVQGNRERGSEWRGTVSNYTPTPMMAAVRFLDDSPQDGVGGPIVYDVRLKINGRFRDDIIPTVIHDDATRDRTTAITDKLEALYIDPPSRIYNGKPSFDFYSTDSQLLKYVDFIYMQGMIQGNNSETISQNYSKELMNQYYQILEPGKANQANGYEYILYLFDFSIITEEVYRVEAVTTVANDYNIQTAMVYTTETSGGVDPTGKPKDWYSSTYWRTQAQAEGNIQDGSNLKKVSVDFGFQTASIVYGIDADFNYYGLKIKGEYAINDNLYMFADGRAGEGMPMTVLPGQKPRAGYRWTERDNAYYITLDKQWDKFGVSGEVFKMGKFYKPYLDWFNSKIKGYTEMRNNFSRINLVEDNDDDDMYPDTMVVQRSTGYRLLAIEDPDGVFPGNDMDNDGIPDNNRNGNSMPDYNEPYLMFDVDPDDFVFGNDYNNNSIPDFREDDMKLDTPYDLDRQGYHYLLRYSPINSLNIIGGSMRTEGVGLSNRTYDDYLKMMLDYDVFDVGTLYAEYRYEQIQDNIRDPYIQVENQMLEDYALEGISSTVNRYSRALYYDELEYRNSNVNRLFIESNIRAVPSITLENHIKFESNDQVEGNMYDGTYQQHDVLNTLALVNKAVYTKSVGNWTFSPGMKFRIYKKARSESLQPLDYYMLRIPLFMVKYRLSNFTNLSLGMQGIPGMETKYVDYVQSQNDYSKKNYIIQLENRTSYFGYNIWAAVGIKFEQLDYAEEYRIFEEYKQSSTFVNVYLGW